MRVKAGEQTLLTTLLIKYMFLQFYYLYQHLMVQTATGDVIKQQHPPVQSSPVCYSRCTELMRSLYFLRSSLLRSALSSSLSRDPPSSPSLCSSSAAPFRRGVSSSLAALLLLIFIWSAGRWRKKILYTHTQLSLYHLHKPRWQPKLWLVEFRHSRK